MPWLDQKQAKWRVHETRRPAASYFRPRSQGGAAQITALTMTMSPTTLPDDAGSTLSERLLAATQLLESVAADPHLLDQLPADDRARLHQAVARIYHLTR